jgi:FtsZ-binding cell division protein ZapB
LQRIEELEQENEVLRERLEEAEEDIERLHRENEQLRKELLCQEDANSVMLYERWGRALRDP